MKTSMRKLLSLLLCILMAGTLVACAPASEEPPVTNPASSSDTGNTDAGQTPSSSEKTYKIAALIPGSINDGGWGTLGYTAAKSVAEKYNAEFSYVEISAPADVLEAAEDYSERGFDLIFAHSYDYQDACKKVADQYPDTYYVVTSGKIESSNMTGIANKGHEGGYLAGVVAATVSQTKKIAYVGPTELPNIKEAMVGFEQGAKSIDPNIEVICTFLGTGTDVGKAKESALALIGNGVDVMLVNANQATQGAYAAGMENIGKVKMIAANSIMSTEYPELIVADMPNDYSAGVEAALKDIMAGTFEAGTYVMGVADGAIRCQLSEQPEMEIPQATYDAFETAKAGISDGSIVVKRTENE